MATVYLKYVESSPARTQWVSGNSYVVGDRVYLESASLKSYDANGTEFSSSRTYVCLNDNSSTTSPEDDSTNWAEAGATKEYPYHSVGGSFQYSESYLEATNGRYATSGVNGSLYHHLRRGESFYSLGKLIILSDDSNPLFLTTTPMLVLGFSIEPDPSIGRFSIVYNGPGSHIGSWSGHNDPDTQYGQIYKCDIYMSSSNSRIVGTIYQNLNKVEFIDCFFTSKASLVGYADTTATSVELGGRNFLGFIRCSFLFPDHDIPYILFDSQFHSTGVKPFIISCTFVFNRQTANYLFSSTKSANIKDNIFYFKSSNNEAVNLYANASQNIGSGNCVYFNDGTTLSFANGGSPDDYTYINPNFISTETRSGLGLRPSSPLIGGITTVNPLNEKYPDGLWVDSAHTEINASYSFSLDAGDGSNYTFSGDATGTDPSINANIRDTLVFTNTTGAHALAIYNSQGIQVASEASGTTTFTPKYPDTYYYQCTVPGHENMRGDIVVTLGALGSYEHPFESYHDAIDSGYYNSKMILLFKEGDHLMSWYPGTNHTNNPGISSSFPGGLSFVGEDSETTRFTTGDNFNSYAAFYVGASLFSGSSQSQTPLTIEDMGFYINNTSGYLNRGLFSGVHWKSFTLKRSKVTCDLGGTTNSGLFDYFSSVAPAGYEFNLSGCEMNVPISDNNGPGGSFLSGDPDIKYTVNSCSFTKLDGYNYVHNGPSPIMIGGAFSSSNGSEIKNCIFYSNTGGDFSSSSVIASGVFSSCIFYSATDSFTNLPPDMDVNSAAEPLFINTLAGSEDLRSRPDSSAIGGIFKSKYPADTIWVQSGTGSGTGTEGDPFYWSEYSEAFLAAVQSSSNQIVFKDGQYVWTSAILQDDNVGNNITMISENIHQAIFTDAGRISSATKYPTLRFKGIQLVANDHFTWQQECHYILDSVHVLAGKYMGARSVTASGCIFEVPSGVNDYVFSSTGPVDITNCTFVDHNDRASGSNYLTGAQSGTIKSTIFYTKTPKTYCINPSHNAVLTNCASENITNPEDGVVFNENLGFLDIDNKNYNLRPTSKLIGRAL